MISDSEFKKLQKEVKTINEILFGIADDPRFKAKIRATVVSEEHATDKPRIINKNGKIYKLQTV